MNDKLNIEELAELWLLCKKELENLKADFESLDDQLKKVMHEQGIESIVIDKDVVTLQVNERRTFDASVLKSLIKPAIFNKVTKPAVDTSLIDAAVSMGDIPEEVLEQATKKTEYKQLRVKRG